MQIKLIQTQDYLLLIDEEAEILPNDLIERDGNVYKCTIANKVEVIVYEKNRYSGSFPPIECRNIIAYYPLTKEAKELDLPLLPNPFENEVYIQELAKEEIKFNHKNIKEKHEIGYRIGFEQGYKAAQAKQFSSEDMIKAIEMAQNSMYTSRKIFSDDVEIKHNFTSEEILQSLSTQQLPKEFIPNYGTPFVMNSEGKQELVGTYKY